MTGDQDLEYAGQRSETPDQSDDAVQVMVVDDRAPNRRVLTRLASQLAVGTDVAAFADGRAALEAARAAPPDLVITDYKMPGLSGADFVAALRTTEATQDVPVIVVTAYEDKSFRYDALKAGASDFLLSPVDKFEFLQRCRNLLTMRQQQRELARQAAARERRLARQSQLRERELHLSEEKFRLVVNALPALVTAVDTAGRISFVNTQYARTYGLDDTTDVVGLRWSEVAPSDVASRHDEADAAVRASGGPISFEETVDDAHGRRLTLLTSKASLRDGDGNTVYVITVSVDMTEQKRVTEELDAAREEAQAANRAKTEFLANISHELRTPLNAVLGFADVGRRELFGPIGSSRYRDYQEDIHRSATHLMVLIDDLLDISRLELGRMSPHLAWCDLVVEAERVVAGHQEAAAARNITLTFDGTAVLPALRTDAGRFRQILNNLVSNAVKYADPNGHVTVTLEPIPDGGVRAIVADDGPGMTTDEIKLALSRFGRVGRAATHSQPGVGLGLPISRDLAKLLGGSLLVQSTPGSGTRIEVSLPNHPEIEPASPESAAGTYTPGGEGG